ncbi:unnamed protein product [Phyllotreta striolata]|uniref:DUF3752 domain-containing protein n=1 Tax=Phyllotreta striolata TaxID=444603 RepID=A0A9N9TIT2_PHYSR|nr:unnamed protein product [Phyllotreta striolata]
MSSGSDNEHDETISSSKDKVFGPALPSSIKKDSGQQSSIIGPALPPHFKQTSSLIADAKCDSNQIIGPELPPHLKVTSTVGSEAEPKVIGPVLPPHLRNKLISSTAQEPESSEISSTLDDDLKYEVPQPSELQDSDDDDDDAYGPLPLGANQTKAHVELEERALQMKIDLLNPNSDKEPAREEWMLKLPPSKAANLGLGPRQFRSKEAPDLSDRSSWTDTPEDRAKKRKTKNEEPLDIKKSAAIRELKKRDKEQEEMTKKHKRSSESLVDIHMKKKKDEKPESTERRPFSREVDLKVNRFDEAQKKAVLKKAQLLDTRFSTGESKFL